MTPGDQTRSDDVTRPRTPFVVTPEQLSEGYFERRGMLAWNRRYTVIRRLPDGNYVVEYPGTDLP